MVNLATALLIWSIFNIFFGALIFGIPAFIFSHMHYKDHSKHFKRAIFFNILSTLIGIGITIYLIIYIVNYAQIIKY